MKTGHLDKEITKNRFLKHFKNQSLSRVLTGRLEMDEILKNIIYIE